MFKKNPPITRDVKENITAGIFQGIGLTPDKNHIKKKPEDDDTK